MAIALATGTHEFHFILASLLTEFDLGRTKIAEHGEMGFPTQLSFQFLSYSNATAYYHDIDIIGRTFEEDITNIAPHHVALNAHCVGNATNLVENFLIQYLGQSGI